MKKSNKDHSISFFQSDRAILMVCISIALIFWLLVKLSQSFRTNREVNIQYDIPPGNTFVESPPQKMLATIKGKGWDLMSHYFSSPQINIQFDLPDDPAFTINSSLMKSKIAREMPNLEVVEVDYDYIVLNMESEEMKRVPIQFNAQLNFEEQYHLIDSISFEPDSITITGPASLIDPIQFWPSEELILDKVRSNMQPIVLLVASSNPQIKLSPNSLVADIQVEQFTEKSLFAPIKIKNAPDSLAVFPDQVKITCIVGFSKYEALRQDDFTLEVDLKNIPLNTTNNTLPISISRQPNFVRGVQLSNQSVEFFFVKSSVDSLDNPPIDTIITTTDLPKNE